MNSSTLGAFANDCYFLRGGLLLAVALTIEKGMDLFTSHVRFGSRLCKNVLGAASVQTRTGNRVSTQNLDR
jgi:hypothetical protein